MKQITAIFIPFLIFCSCQSAKKPNVNADSASNQINVNLEMQDLAEEDFNSFLAQLPKKDLPFTDSTNFDNFNNEGLVNVGLLQLLKFKPDHPELDQVHFRYQVKFDQGLTGLVLTFPNSESELKTVLLTLDENNQRLDVIEIAYDEIVESAYRLISVLDKNMIRSEHWNYFSEEPKVDQKVFKLQNNLRFIQH